MNGKPTPPKIAQILTRENSKQRSEALKAQTLAGGALLDVEELVEAQSVLVPSQSLLMQLELP